MADENVVELEDTRKLDKTVKALMKLVQQRIKIGIFSANHQRTDGGNNAQIGFYHEFGIGHNPQRSFLRTPIQDNLQKQLQKSGALDKDALKQMTTEGDMTLWLEKVAVLMEAIVAEGFNTGGYGKWPASNMDHKKNAQTLVETQQLRNSISTEVK